MNGKSQGHQPDGLMRSLRHRLGKGTAVSPRQLRWLELVASGLLFALLLGLLLLVLP